MNFKLINKYYFFIIFICLFSCQESDNNSIIKGQVFGTSYSVIYNSEINFETQFDSLFYLINKSMSTYQTNSDISKINRNEDSIIDKHFLNVFLKSKEIFKTTNGAFDPTIGSVVNAWDFGPKGAIKNLDSLKVDSLMKSVGLYKVSYQDNNGDTIISKSKNTFIDFNAIAKGYAVDVIGNFLESKNISNYLVEIGGEIRCKGLNREKQKAWTVGVEMPRFDGEQSVLKSIQLREASMATSGTYRKFKVDENGNRYAHIIDTKTGYPSKTNLLSVSVITNDCMTADAYATAFKAMGIDKVKAFLKAHPELKVFLIFENDDKEFETLSLNGFPE